MYHRDKRIPEKNICFIDYTKAFDCVDHNKLWKILKEMGIPDYLTCLLRNLYAAQKQVRNGHGTMDWFKIGKGVCQGYILSPCLFKLLSQFFVFPYTVAFQAPLFMRFPRQEYWNGLPFSSPGDLPKTENKPMLILYC